MNFMEFIQNVKSNFESFELRTPYTNRHRPGSTSLGARPLLVRGDRRWKISTKAACSTASRSATTRSNLLGAQAGGASRGGTRDTRPRGRASIAPQICHF